MSLVTSNPNKQLPSTQELSAEQVANWLSNNSDFFIGRESILAKMQLEHDCGESTESLLLYQLKLLRQELNQHKQNHEQLLNNARDNEKRLKRIERLLVKLLEAENTEELITLLNEELEQNFNLPFLRVWSHSSLEQLPRATEDQQEKQLALLDNKSSVSLQLTSSVAALLGLDELQEGSAIICRLSHSNHLGLLVIAHPSSKHFRQQDTLFIEYLGAILSSLLHRHQPKSH
ncbi:DUF484 family protein [Marinospirillum insulare]|uniref:DUF484 domain-containing protein n=1 Tax=Marinospirillum insulare TaxID=217169 RepID=A0ABQ5ZXD5_9GAMM|nr:DUF484 family protein [Marinospirillum insulare]GLR64136.1 hypothetical protein GCM10007878_15740 [Marinospirillum insulare]